MKTKLIPLAVFAFIFLMQSSISQIIAPWPKIYSSPGNADDSPFGMAYDASSGSVFVAGRVFGYSSNYDVIIIRYNVNTGDTTWVKRINGSAPTSDDNVTAILVGPGGFLYITGWIFNSAGNRDMFVAKYNISTGAQVWISTFNGAYNGGDYSYGVALDVSDNVYITGRSDTVNTQRYTTIKYNSSGVRQWVAYYSGPGTFDEARSIKVDGSANVYITGFSRSGGAGSEDYATVKYNSSGVQQWAKRYSGSGNGEDYAYFLLLDGSNNVYVSGYSRRVSADLDYVTIKYNGSTGDSLAVGIYNGPISGQDAVTGMTKDASDNFYITGYSQGTSTGADYLTVKYNSSLQQQWSARSSGSAGSDYSTGIAVNSSGETYVTGRSLYSGSNYEWWTVKYSTSGSELNNVKYRPNPSGNHVPSGIVLDGVSNAFVTGSVQSGTSSGTDIHTIRYWSTLSGVTQISNEVPNSYSLSQNYPNPFNPATTIRFAVPKYSYIRLAVYDMLGREVEVLVNENISAGTYETNLDASKLSTGVYFYKLNSDNYSETRKMILAK